jgi:hypothetical protein
MTDRRPRRYSENAITQFRTFRLLSHLQLVSTLGYAVSSDFVLNFANRLGCLLKQLMFLKMDLFSLSGESKISRNLLWWVHLAGPVTEIVSEDYGLL